MNYLVTGACGFIGSNFADYILRYEPDSKIVNVDKHTSVSNQFLNIKYCDDDRYSEFTDDLVDTKWIDKVEMTFIPNVIVHFAAESHVDRSCENVVPFIDSNITATMNVVDYAIKHSIPMVYISTDEVYGELGMDDAPFTEHTPIDPRNPYSATKASGEFILKTLANAKNYNKYVITRCSNNYGHWQDKTKLIPVAIKALLDGEKIPIYGEGKQVRDWIHVLDHCIAVRKLAHTLVTSSEVIPNTYNIGGSNEFSNLDIAKKLCDILDIKYEDGIRFIHDPRGSAHDLRYAIDSSLFSKSFNWSPEYTHPFDESLTETVNWYKKHTQWIY